MKQKLKIIIIIIIIIIVGLIGVKSIYSRIKESENIKSGIFYHNGKFSPIYERKGEIIKETTNMKTTIYIPITNQKKLKIHITIYDKNNEKILINTAKENEIEEGRPIFIFTKEKYIGLFEYKMPNQDIVKKLNKETFEINLDNIKGYFKMNGDNTGQRIIKRGKIEGVYITLLHGPNTQLEFSVIE